MAVLSVDVLVAVVEGVDVMLFDGNEGTARSRDVHGLGDLLDHDGGLDGSTCVAPDREGAVVAHEDSRRARFAQGIDDAAPDRVVADESEGTNGDGTAKLVAHHGQDAWNLLSARGPGGGVG